jgi:thiosulfate reductase cytochrome b subunit
MTDRLDEPALPAGRPTPAAPGRAMDAPWEHPPGEAPNAAPGRPPRAAPEGAPDGAPDEAPHTMPDAASHRVESHPEPGANAPPPSRRAPALETVRVVRKHHPLVRLTHWVNVPLLIGLTASGLSIYWAAPVFQHPQNPVTLSRDYVADLGVALSRVLPERGADPRNWIYDHFGLGGRALATGLRLHWALAYFFMLNGALYLVGLLAGGGWRALLPRRSDLAEGARMIRFYLGVIPMRLLRRPWPHPPVTSKYNALQRAAYFAMPILGLLVTLSGWAMHKPVQLGWLERMFVSYDGARVVHFACMVALAGFIVPHVALVIADGWDTFRSMVVGWSARVKEGEHA